jgi:hypothetical protein
LARPFRGNPGGTHGDDPPSRDDHRDAGAVHRRSHRLRARPLGALRQQRRQLPRGPRPRPTEADVTEGSGGVWEREHYDWSDPNHVVIRTTDSNTWGGDSGHTYDFKHNPDGTTDIDYVVVREGKNLKGRFLGVVLGSVGKGRLESAFAKSVKAIEARNGKAGT